MVVERSELLKKEARALDKPQEYLKKNSPSQKCSGVVGLWQSLLFEVLLQESFRSIFQIVRAIL
ncbi:MAG: hypothetical protein RJB38_961 [Pseudomonadota bacterium]